MKFYQILYILLLFTCMQSNAQGKVEVTKNLNYKQEVNPEGMDNYLYSTYYFSGKRTYNMKGFEMNTSSNNVVSMKISPAGNSYATLTTNNKKWEVNVYDLRSVNKVLHTFKKEITDPRAICYSADSRTIIIGDNSGTLHFFNTKDFNETNQITINDVAKDLISSNNEYYTAAVTNTGITIINNTSKTVRTKLPYNQHIQCVRFSDDSSLLGILSENELVLYSTIDFSRVESFTDLSNASSFTFHPDGKYIGIATDKKDITFHNMMDKSDISMITEPRGGISCTKFVKDGKDKTYITYNATGAICYKAISGFLPNYTKRMRDELNKRLMEWCKKRPNETEKEYQARVNDQAKEKQKKLIASEISTELAGDLMENRNVTLGRYNPNRHTLSLDIDGLSTVLINVPQKEIGAFKDVSKLNFSNVKYGLNKEDKFEVIYADIYNKANGKSYTFDNLDQQDLSFLTTDDEYISLDIIDKANREEVQLKRIRKRIVDRAQQKNEISDHTQIQVKTQVTSDFDADGNRIKNYKIDFDYTVDAEFSAKEDFAPGKYQIEQSHAAVTTLDIIKQALTEDFSQYIVAGKKLKIKITGSADALPITGSIAYNGCYGEFEDEPCFIDGDMTNITVKKSTGIKTNNQLAFMRAQGVKSYLKNNLTCISNMDVEYEYNIVVSEGKGGEFRRINVNFTFIDAIK